jgi:hypothetical protein
LSDPKFQAANPKAQQGVVVAFATSHQTWI